MAYKHFTVKERKTYKGRNGNSSYLIYLNDPKYFEDSKNNKLVDSKKVHSLAEWLFNTIPEPFDFVKQTFRVSNIISLDYTDAKKETGIVLTVSPIKIRITSTPYFRSRLELKEEDEKIKFKAILDMIDSFLNAKKEARDLQNGEVAGLLREPSKTIGLAPEGSALDRVLQQGILAKNVGRYLTTEDIDGDTVKPAIKTLRARALGSSRKRHSSKNSSKKTRRRRAHL